MNHFQNKDFKYRLIVVSVLFLISMSSAGKKEEITLGTFNYPPLMLKDPDMNGRHGIGIEIIKQAFSKSEDYSLKVIFLPVKRAVRMAESGKVDLFLGSRLDLSISQENVIPIKIITLKSVLFCYPKQCDQLNKKQHIFNLGRVASIAGSPVNQVLQEAGNTVEIQQELEKTFQFLLTGRADYIAAINFSGHHTLRQINHPKANKIQQADFQLMQIPYDAIVLKNNSKAKKLARIINQQLSTMDHYQNAKSVVDSYFDCTGIFYIKECNNEYKSR